jgi:hypothetical protein
MTATPFDAHSSSPPAAAAQQEPPEGPPREGADQERAVTVLLQHEVLSHTLGTDGEYEVRTTLVTRPAWQYRCCVFRYGKAMTQGFVPISIDRPPPRRGFCPQPGHIDAMRRMFAREAVDVHFARCAALRDYLTLAAVYSQAPPRSRRWYALLVLLLGAAFLAAYGLWKPAVWSGSGRPPGSPPPSVRATQHPVVERQPIGSAVRGPLPALSDEPSDDSPTGQAQALAITSLVGPPKTLRLIDLLALEDPPEGVDHGPGTPTPGVRPGPTASDVHAGDLLRLTGWIHQASRDPDRTYRLRVSPSREAGAPSLIAVVPHPDGASGSPAVRTQLQTVRAFITQRLLRQQEPSLRGSVMRHPVFVQLIGQLLDPDARLGEPSRRKGPRGATARWEVHPVLEIRFVPSPVPSDRARPG